MAGSESPADKQPPDVEAGQERALSGSPAANGTAKRGLLEVAPPAAADGKSEGYTGADEACKLEHEREVLPEDEKAAKPVGYFSLFRWGGGDAVAPPPVVGVHEIAYGRETEGTGGQTFLPAQHPQSLWPGTSAINDPAPTCGRFADHMDWLLMAMGTVGAAGAGTALPIWAILFGDL